jgi:hypothetical protein
VDVLPNLDIVWRDARGFMELPAGDRHHLLVDFGQKVTGHIQVRLGGAGRAGLAIETGPVLGLVRFQGRLDVDNAGGTWEDPVYRALRFVRVRRADAASEPVVADFSLRFTAFPAEYAGHFLCSDDELNRIWYAGAYTVQLNIQPHEYSGAYLHKLPKSYADFARDWRSPHGQFVIWDGPRRDREVWLGDMWPEMMTAMYAFGSGDPVRSSLCLFTQIRNDDGSVPGSGLTRQRFAEYACWWIVLLDRFHLLAGDDAFVREVAATVRSELAWLTQQIRQNEGWLPIGHRNTWAWTLSRRGVVTGSQCVAYGALRGGARLMAVLGDGAASAECLRLADELCGRIRTRLWNNDLGVFRDSLEPVDGVARVSCDSNALALLFGVATPEQARRAMRYIEDNLWGPFGTRVIHPTEPPDDLNWAHNHNIWPFVVGLEVEGRFEAGDHDGAMRLLRRCWGNMLRHGAECFWEMVGGEDGAFVTHRPVAWSADNDMDAWDSYAHGWSAGVTSMLQAYVLGVTPLEPGFRRFRVAPRLGDLAWVEGAVPTPFGPIGVRAERRDGRLAIDVTVPPGTRAVVIPKQDADPGHVHEWLSELGPGRHGIVS